MNASRSEIYRCQFNNWYDQFIGKTFKSKVIPLDTKFVDYLGEDGIVLPNTSKNYFATDVLSDDEDDNLKEVVSESGESNNNHDFGELDVLINNAIKQLGGEVVVKLNWSCPLDSVWMNAGTLKCKSASDVYVLLKSSDRVNFDLDHMYDLCESNNTNEISECMTEQIETGIPKGEAILVLRKWANLNPAMEFRVFIHNHRIVGICQRDCSTYYDFLESKIDEVQDLIYDFFYGSSNLTSTTITSTPTTNTLPVDNNTTTSTTNKIDFNVIERFPLANYTMDVYVDNRQRVWLVDFNPFGEPTCSLLFEWAELCNMNESSTDDITSSSQNAADINIETTHVHPRYDLCEFRIIESSAEVLPSTKGSTRGPIDVHAASEFRNFMELCKKQQAESSDEESEA